MSDPNTPEIESSSETAESFKDVLTQYERGQRKPEAGSGGREGTVIAVTADAIVLDIGFKTEGILPLSAELNGQTVKPGDKLLVTVKGRDPEGYYELTRGKVERPTDWAALEKAFADKSTIIGTVTGVVKGGLSVDVGVRAFMPASRAPLREAGMNARTPTSTLRPPFTTAVTVPMMVDFSLNAFSSAAQSVGRSIFPRTSW